MRFLKIKSRAVVISLITLAATLLSVATTYFAMSFVGAEGASLYAALFQSTWLPLLIVSVVCILFLKLLEALERANSIAAQKEQILQDYIDSSSDFVWEIDVNGRYTYASSGVERIFGYKASEMVGKTPFDFMSGEEAARVGAIFESIMKEQRAFRDLENWNITKSGDLACVVTSGVVFYDSKGEFAGYRGSDRDVSVQKEQERALADIQRDLLQEKEKFKAIFENSKDGIALVDLESNFIEVNEAYATITGFSIQELLGLSCLALSSEEDKVRSLEILKQVQREGYVENFEKSCRRKDGVAINVNMSMALMPDREHMLVNVKNTTKEVQLRKKLQSQKEQYRQLMELAADGIFIMNLDGKVIECSKRASEMLGYEIEQMKELYVYDWDVSHSKEEALWHVKNTPSEPLTFLTKHRRKDGTIYDASVIAVKIQIDEQEYVYASVRDVTRMLSEQKLHQKAENKFRTIFEESLDGLALLDIDTQTFIECNERIVSMYGYGMDEFLKLTPKDLDAIHDLAEIKRVQSLIFEKGWHQFSTQHRTKEGELLNVLVSARKLELDERHILFLTFHDITSQIRAQKEIELAKEQAEAASRSKSEFLANMSHEIRTPMTAILGFVEQLAKNESDPLRIKEFKVIQNSGKTLLNIINDILDFSKIESGKLDVEEHPALTREIFESAMEIAGELAKSKQVICEKSFAPNIPECIMIDELRLKQVVFNLLSNAIKFTPEGGFVRVNVEYDEPNEQIRCQVIDTGIGIAQENIGKIFDSFVQEDSTTTRRFGGTGLGLTISSKLLEMMGGSISVQSTLGKGSTFSFVIPYRECEGAVLKERLGAAALADISELNGHVLVVEDNKTNQMLISMILDEMELEYMIANDGVEALKLYAQERFDAILMDENMPNMNGIEATKRIREVEAAQGSKATPIVALTANALSEDRERFLRAGMDDYISKPYTQEDIARVLQKYLS